MRRYESGGGAHLDQVDFGEGLVISGLLDVEDGNDVFVIKVA